MTYTTNKSLTTNFWTIQRLNRLSVAFLIGVIISLIVSYVSDKENTTILKQGDFPGFYGPAVMMARGLEERLYDQQLQSDVENEFWPKEGAYYSFVYPPFVAYMLKPLGFLDQQTARNIFTVLSLACFTIALYFASRINPFLKEHPFITLAFTLAFVPLFYGVFAGQNTSLSILLYVGSVYFLSSGTKKGDILAGIFIGLWLYKPQFGLIALLFPLLAARFYTLIGFSVPTVIYYLLGARVYGLDWPITWVQTVSVFAEKNFVANQKEIVSIIGALKAVGRMVGDGESLFTILAIILSGFLFLFTILPIFNIRISKMGIQRNTNTPNLGLLSSMALLGPMMTLISPQTLFYDLGISAISCALCFKKLNDRNIWLLFIYFILVGLLIFYRALIPIPSLVIVAFSMYLYAYFSIKQVPISKH